jgi:hypothetical protein
MKFSTAYANSNYFLNPFGASDAAAGEFVFAYRATTAQ